MRIPITKYGLPQVAVFPAMILIVMLICWLVKMPLWIKITAEVLLAVVLVWAFSFFRDPCRVIPADPTLLLSPADGTVADIEVVDNEYIGGPAIRVGIFLSVFNVHINRAPCQAVVEKTQYKEGRFVDARHKDAGRINESNDIFLQRIAEPADKLIVRQISGAVARHIVCRLEPGQQLQPGEKFGMIKFGSRTELYFPQSENVKILAEIGQKAKAGTTIIARYSE